METSQATKTFSRSMLKKALDEFIEKSPKLDFSEISDFESIIQEIKKYFTKSKTRELAKARAKEIIEKEKNLMTLLKWREDCNNNEDLSNLKGWIETCWENIFEKNIKESPEEILSFMEEIKNIYHLPHFAKTCMERPKNYM